MSEVVRHKVRYYLVLVTTSTLVVVVLSEFAGLHR